MHTSIKKYLSAISVLAVAGMLVSAYLVYQHYKPSAGSFCNINSYVNCDIVNKSKYAEIFGFPVGAIGLTGYLVLGAMSFGWLLNWFKKPTHHKIIILSTGALGISLYLTFVEFFILKAVCALCVTSQLLIISIFILSLIVWLKYSE